MIKLILKNKLYIICRNNTKIYNLNYLINDFYKNIYS